MPVQIPPWLNLDPTAPARIRLAANAQRDSAMARSQELQFRREQLSAQQAQESEQSAARERIASRRDQVLKQTHDQELAQAAEQMQLRREAQAQRADQFQQTLRMRQQKAEAEAKVAAQQMEGLKSYQKAVQSGVPHAKAVMDNADKLFAKDPTKAFQGIPQAVQEPRMVNVRDEQNNPTGVFAIPSKGGVHVMRPEGLDARGQAMIDRTRLNYLVGQLREGDLTPAEERSTRREIQALNEKMKNPASYQSQRLPGTLPPRSPAVIPTAPAAQSIQPGGMPSVAPDEGGASVAPDEEGAANMVRVKSPDGKMGSIPEDQLDDALEAGYEEIEADNEKQA